MRGWHTTEEVTTVGGAVGGRVGGWGQPEPMSVWVVVSSAVAMSENCATLSPKSIMAMKVKKRSSRKSTIAKLKRRYLCRAQALRGTTCGRWVAGRVDGQSRCVGTGMMMHLGARLLGCGFWDENFISSSDSERSEKRGFRRAIWMMRSTKRKMIIPLKMKYPREMTPFTVKKIGRPPQSMWSSNTLMSPPNGSTMIISHATKTPTKQTSCTSRRYEYPGSLRTSLTAYRRTRVRAHGSGRARGRGGRGVSR